MPKYNPKWGSRRRRTAIWNYPCRPQTMNLVKILMIKGVREVPGYGDIIILLRNIKRSQYVNTIDQGSLIRTLVDVESATEWPDKVEFWWVEGKL